MKRIFIQVAGLRLEAQLNDTLTAQKIYEALPLKGRANVWGEEIYFEIPLKLDMEPDARTDVDVGELGYWPVGAAFCVFFGPTPVSTDDRPKAYSPVNVFGKVDGDAKALTAVENGASITITAG